MLLVEPGDFRDRLLLLHDQMSSVADEQLLLWIHKVIGYGLSRYDEHDLDFDVWMNFSDIHRKYIRLEQLTRRAARSDDMSKRDIEDLVEQYRDIINYSISAVLQIERFLDD